MIYAGEAHSAYLAGSWTVDAETGDMVSAAPDELRTLSASVAASSLVMALGRQGPPVGRDPARQLEPRSPQGTLDIEEDKLLEDAQRDWSALGQELQVARSRSRFAQGRDIP